jgi:5-methylthioadenosine/S-adenosylhomocysteine deaminase
MSRTGKIFRVLFYVILFSTITVRLNGQVKKDIDILISGGTILTVNSSMDVIQNGSIAIKGGKILAIGKKNDIDTLYLPKILVKADGKIVMPGLINTHTHAAMTLLRGFADDMLLDDWLQNKIWPAEAKFMNAENIKAGTLLAIAEMISGGVTCFNDMYFFEDGVAQTAKAANMRVLIGEGILEYPTPDCQTPDAALAVAEGLINKYNNDSLVTVAVAPHSPYACSRETLVKAKTLSDKYNVPLHIHLSETESEIDTVMAKYQMRPPAFLNSIGLLNERTVAAHCICLDSSEVKLLAEKKVGVAHCPSSNMKLGEKVAPVTPMLALKMKVSFGTDGAASNNNLSILNEMRTGSLLQKTTYGDPTVVNAQTAVRMATIEAAKVLSLDQKIGSLEKDKYADIIIVDLSAPNVTPSYDPYSTILYSAEDSDVNTVIINGKVVMMDRNLLTIDKDKAVGDVNRIAGEIAAYYATSVQSAPSVPKGFQLDQNYPNPFNPSTRIIFQLQKESRVKLEIYNILGERITQLLNETKSAGNYIINWNAGNSVSGIYFYRVQAVPTGGGNAYSSVKKMILIM